MHEMWLDEKPQHIATSQSDIDKGANKLSGSYGVETIYLILLSGRQRYCGGYKGMDVR